MVNFHNVISLNITLGFTVRTLERLIVNRIQLNRNLKCKRIQLSIALCLRTRERKFKYPSLILLIQNPWNDTNKTVLFRSQCMSFIAPLLPTLLYFVFYIFSATNVEMIVWVLESKFREESTASKCCAFVRLHTLVSIINICYQAHNLWDRKLIEFQINHYSLSRDRNQ